MDSAFDVILNEIVEAEALWEITSIDKERYRCVGCGVKIFPASYKRDINKKRPYFTLGSSGTHDEPCDIDGNEDLIERAKGEELGKSEGFPLPYPNKLLLTDVRLIESSDDIEKIPSVSPPNRNRSIGRGGSNYNHGHTVKTIRPIAKAFIRYPHDRKNLSLEIPGCEGRTFEEVFWRLGKIMRFRNPMHLYYAPLHWKAPIKTKEYIEWQLSAGDWNDEEKMFAVSYRVRVDWSEWSDPKKNALEAEVECARNDAKLSGGRVKAWLFFIGVQTQDKPHLIIVERYQSICCLEGGKTLKA